MKILIVDDETNIRELMRRYLKLEGIESDGAENGLSAQRLIQETPYDACLLDVRMPGMDGLQLLGWMRQEGYRFPVIMISAHGDVRDAVTALKTGAQDYILKPFDPDELSLRLKKLVEAQVLKNLVESESRASEDTSDLFIGEAPAVIRIKDITAKIADSPATVLITGESGTGKEVVARRIHSCSILKNGPFVAINIGGVPENLLESELFGYEKGAFTGAVARKTGMFELASGGTLFLDEIGDMPHALQVKLLRVLQERRITRLGGTTSLPINARIIAATNKTLEDQVRSGAFREDLFYRLNVVRIEIPPLRERRGDISLLAASILARLNREMGRHITGLSPEALEKLQRHAFHGNVRELENIMERAVIFAEGAVITEDDLDIRGSIALGEETANEAGSGNAYPPLSGGEGLTLRQIEAAAIVRSLHRWEGNRTRAAEELGIGRRTLINKIAEFGLNV
ncbi:sigma-54-dependent transcriptional regulator [Parasphaerochaeta coccoides]|uniref:DNA-binding transcriptional regulator NtrC n=1 Tax=Parasphaerochaeta coccoides (strain ATCC BAA-1237 / DSM 17374 / SPN1) TaxID=760011 RepID=F4GHG9_PARC1|nr:sigma-54 dependent transcriptional regulator [Parasphaerochaeta coccoides]AEC02558.1 two component, sigma54 specific, transcriptional regulator, Fis family [Parasphaerochaeta coccoides DSM 17374]